MKLTPKKIREAYRSASPYQVEDIMKDYIGQKICWNLEFFSVTKKGDGGLNVGLFSEEGSAGSPIHISCTIEESSFPLIRLLPRNSLVILMGEIAGIDSTTVAIKNAHLQEIRDDNGQIYFSQGSRESFLAFLESKIFGAKKIKIYDSYPSDDILKLLESASSKAEVQLLGQNIDIIFSGKIKAFNNYFNKNMIAKKINVSHARFYIIDGEVLQVDSSLKNSGGNKATMINIIDKEVAEAVKKDFDKWWNNAIEV